MIPLPSPMLTAAGVAALVATYCVAGVVTMAGVESAAANGCDAPTRRCVAKAARS